MAQKVLKFGKPGKRYPIENVNGEVVEIVINTTDFNIPKRLADSDKIFTSFMEKYDKVENNDSLEQEVLPELDKATREQINYIFGTDIVTPVFGVVSTWSLNDEGMPLWIPFLECIGEAVLEDMEVKSNKFNTQMNKYMKK
jgi:hypothetical protein